jgi:hypothetical protein
MKKNLPSTLTSYDLLKAAAVIIMVIDHMGFYFFPDDEWWRAVGRIGFPVWFFLVGHASGRDISPKLWGGALILIAASLAVGMPLFALNALVTIILIRLVIDQIMDYAAHSPRALAQVCVLLIVLALPTSLLCEYGTEGLLFAVFGYAVRHRENLWPGRNVTFNIMLTCFVSFGLLQKLVFGFSLPAFLFMATGTLATCLILMEFKAREYPRLSAVIPGFFKAPIQFMGRHTLEIYVGHLLVFKAIAATLHPETYHLFEFGFFTIPENG